MSNSTVNFTNLENSTTHSLGLMDYVEISVYSINLLFGSLTHSYVLWLIVTGSSGVASEFLNLNLSVYELGICLNNLIFVLSMRIASLSEFAIFLVSFSFTGRPLFQCLMCVERYLAVVHPVTFLKYKPLRYRVICCTTAWVITVVSCFFCVFYVATQSTNIYARLLACQMIFLFSVQLFCLVAVLRALKQSRPRDRKREKEENHMKRRAFQIILVTFVNTIFMYVPKALIGFYEMLTGDETKTNMFTTFTCFILTGYVQPLLYLHRSGKLSCPCS